jgi:hypothetical protein
MLTCHASAHSPGVPARLSNTLISYIGHVLCSITLRRRHVEGNTAFVSKGLEVREECHIDTFRVSKVAVGLTVSQSVSQPLSQPATQSTSHSVSQPLSQPLSQPATQSVSHSISQSAAQSVS